MPKVIVRVSQAKMAELLVKLSDHGCSFSVVYDENEAVAPPLKPAPVIVRPFHAANGVTANKIILDFLKSRAGEKIGRGVLSAVLKDAGFSPNTASPSTSALFAIGAIKREWVKIAGKNNRGGFSFWVEK